MHTASEEDAGSSQTIVTDDYELGLKPRFPGRRGRTLIPWIISDAPNSLMDFFLLAAILHSFNKISHSLLFLLCLSFVYLF